MNNLLQVLRMIQPQRRHKLPTLRHCLLMLSVLLAAPATAEVTATGPSSSRQTPSHGIAMHGQPRLADGFAHFPYVNPKAPKGGGLRLGVLGTFDSLNPFIVRGNSASGVRAHVFESLMGRSADEPFALYGLIARRIAIGPERRSITFYLRPEAKFSDGKPITSADVVFSHRMLSTKGWPYLRAHYSKVARITTPDAHTVMFEFGPQNDREIALIMGLMPILPRHRFNEQTFDRTTLQPIIGSGPYTITNVKPGRSLTYRRNPNYWGSALAQNVGRHNFETVQIEYYRDEAALFEAFKTGQIDIRIEQDPARWADSYTFPAVRAGQVRLTETPSRQPAGMSALVFNTRRTVFKDKRVRRALIEAFHFATINRQLYHGLYARTASYFARSQLSSVGKPASPVERQIFVRFPGVVSPRILAGHRTVTTHTPPRALRQALKSAYSLLTSAGYVAQNGWLRHTKTGKRLAFEFLAANKRQERLMLAYARILRRLGIKVLIRQVHTSQYQSRRNTFDFDMIQWRWPASLSPGNEQISRWSSKAADTEGTLNYPGVREPAVDAAISLMLSAKDRHTFEAGVHALDRILLSGDYVIPLFHARHQWIAYWNHIARPSVAPLNGVRFDTWWYRGQPN